MFLLVDFFFSVISLFVVDREDLDDWVVWLLVLVEPVIPVSGDDESVDVIDDDWVAVARVVCWVEVGLGLVNVGSITRLLELQPGLNMVSYNL